MTDTPAIDPAVVLWSAPEAERAGRPLLVLLHGYGTDERDLFGLVPSLPDDFVVAAVRAPRIPPFPAPGYSWYPLDGPEARNPAWVTSAAEGVLAWLDDIRGDAPTVGMLGFSQGGVIALECLRLRPHGVGFVVNLSGYASPAPLPTDAELAAVKPPAFWGRGTADAVIPDALVAHTAQWLPGHVDLSGRVYPALGHSVSEEELRDVRVFLDKRLAEG